MISQQQFNDLQARLAKQWPIGAAGAVDKESDLHESILAHCRLRGWYCVRSRMDKRPTNGVGVPDFIIAADRGRTLYVEAKARKSKLTTDQVGVREMLLGLGHVHFVCRSYAEFLASLEVT